MKVLMLNPPFLRRYSRQSRSPCVTKGGTFYYPYYLSYATGVLEENNFTVKLIDAIAKNWSHEKTVTFAKHFKADLTILDTSTPSIFNDIEIGSKIKEALPETHLSLVGTHPTNLIGETFKLSNNMDSICRGEYDYTVRDLAFAIKEGKELKWVKGLSYRDNGQIINNENREFIKNLDELPFVSRVYKDHLNVEDYFYSSLTHPEIVILTARGCPYNCSFCPIPFKNSYRARSPENVFEEFDYIEKNLPEVKEVMIEDDTFPINKKRTIELCKLLVENDINLKWSCNARVDTDFKTLRYMKKAGCRLMCVGFESASQNVLDGVYKRTTKNRQMKFMKESRKADLLVNGCFILGLLGDTKESIRETIKFAKKLNPDTAQFYPPMAYPGTKFYDQVKKMGYLITENYSEWLTEDGLHNSVVSRPGLTNKELVEFCDTARKEYYLRGNYIIYKLIQNIAHPSEVKRNFISFKKLVKYLIRGASNE